MKYLSIIRIGSCIKPNFAEYATMKCYVMRQQLGFSFRLRISIFLAFEEDEDNEDSF